MNSRCIRLLILKSEEGVDKFTQYAYTCIKSLNRDSVHYKGKKISSDLLTCTRLARCLAVKLGFKI